MVVLKLLFKFMILMLLTSSYVYRSSMPSLLLYIIYSLHVYINYKVLVFEGITAVVWSMLGIQLEAALSRHSVRGNIPLWAMAWLGYHFLDILIR
jgi:hypothetical protein